MKIGLDIDGVLANFPKAFLAKAKEYDLGFLFPDKWEDVNCWYIAHGNNPDAFKAVWRHIKDDISFWRDLEPFPYVTPFDFEVDCYVTARPIDGHETRHWLNRHAFPEATVITVQTPDEKIPIITARELDVFVDDHWETVRKLRAVGVNALLYEAPYQSLMNLSDLPTIKHLREVNNVIR